MRKLTFEHFADLLDDAVDRIPEHFLRDLTGGFNLQRKANRDGEYYIMGMWRTVTAGASSYFTTGPLRLC